MTKKTKPYLDVDYHMNDMEDEVVISVRTSDGSKLQKQDILDGVMHYLEEIHGTEVEPITKEEIKKNTNIH